MTRDLVGYARQAASDWDVPGVALGVVRDGEVALAEGLGTRQVGADLPVGPDTIFGIGSLTKGMTATAIGLLIDEGKLQWDDRVCDLMPAFGVAHPFVAREATVRDLLCHRSGVDDAPLLYTGAVCTSRDLFHKTRLLTQKVSFRSGFVYNNLMYLALGFLIEAISGQTYSDFLRDRIFVPLGMTRTSVGAASDEDVAAGHVRVDGKAIEVPAGCGDLDLVAPSGAVRSTLRDVLRWSALYVNRGRIGRQRLVSADVLHEIEALQTVVHAPRFVLPTAHFQGYGLGWRVGDHRGRKVLPAGGRVAGGTAEILYVPESHVAVVVLANMDLSWMGYAVGYEILDHFLRDEPVDWSARMRKWTQSEKSAPELTPIATGPTSLPAAKYAGVYHNALLGDITVNWDEKLRLHYNREVSGDLDHLAFDAFALRSHENPLLDHRRAAVTFRLDPLGRVEALWLCFPVAHHEGEFDRVRFERRGG